MRAHAVDLCSEHGEHFGAIESRRDTKRRRRMCSVALGVAGEPHGREYSKFAGLMGVVSQISSDPTAL